MGHYDECREGYCSVCGQTEGNCEHTKDKAKKKSDKPEKVMVNVRWFDGYLEKFEASEARFGSDLLWIRLLSGKNRHIPLRQVRWFSVTPESHETLDKETVK